MRDLTAAGYQRYAILAVVLLCIMAAGSHAATRTVTVTADSGAGSLRDAVMNAVAGDTIAFNLPTNNTPPFPLPAFATITLTTGPITLAVNNVTIDGTTQPNVKAVEINGSGAGAGNSGLVITATGCTIKGLVINRCPNHGISVQGGSNTIIGNQIGTNFFGNAALNNGGDGIQVTSAGNTIGGTAAGARNILSGNALSGVELTGAACTGNVVLGNYCGLNAKGSAAVGNFDGIDVNSGADGNTVGGTAAGAGNVCSGNAHDGIHIESSDNTTIQGNFVGVNAAGNAIITDSAVFGIEVSDCTGTVVGGTVAGARNVVGGNAAGIELDAASTGNTVQGNYAGLGADGVSQVGNRLHGIVLRDAGVKDNLIGGTVAGAGNTVAYNGTGGIAVFGDPTVNPQNTGNALLGNSVYLNGRSSPTTLLGIDLVSTKPFPTDDGNTANHNPVSTVGPNNLQNYPLLTSASPVAGGGTKISGTLFATAGATFRVEFFSSPAASASGFGEGQTFLGFANVATDASGNAAFAVTVGGTSPAGEVVTATATDPGNNTSEFSPAVKTLFAFSGGSQTDKDSDGDGFSDELETALSTDPINAKSTPLGGVPVTAPSAISAAKLSIKLNFGRTSNDSIKLAGGLATTAGSAAGQSITFDIGGVIKTAVLSSKGTAIADEFKIKVAIKNGTAKFAVTGTKGSYADKLADEGLVNASASKVAVTIPVVVLFNNTLYRASIAATYTAKAGKIGSSK